MIKRIFDRSPFQLAVIAGVLVGFSYPPIPGFTAWFGFLPLIHIWRTQMPKESARWSFFASVIANLISLYWIGLNSGANGVAVLLSLVGAILYLGIMWAGFGWIVALIEKKIGNCLIIIPFLFTNVLFLSNFKKFILKIFLDYCLIYLKSR